MGYQKKGGQSIVKLIAFRLKHYKEQQIIIIQWLTSNIIAQKVKNNNYVIQKEDIKNHIELIHKGIVQEEVDINLIRPLCTINAWNVTTNLIELKKTFKYLDMSHLSRRHL